MKRFIRAGMAAALCLLLALSAILPAAALTPSYTVEAPYLTSPYYEALVAVELSGDMRRDVLTVAFTQIGYHEGDSMADMDGLNIFGNKNFVEYNRLYGKLDNGEGNGVSYGYAWCAAFVSWCERQAGVPESLCKTEVSCIRMTNWFLQNATYHALADGYTPLPGDLIMFHDGDNSADHVGLVVGVKDGEVYTIEGNSGGVVGQHMYAMTDRGIMGYCVPNYTVKEGTVYDFPLDAEASKPGTYIVTADSLNVRAGAGASYAKLGALSLGDEVEIALCDGAWGRIEFAGREGWISMSYVAPASNLIYSIRYDAGEGKGGPTAQRKRPGESVTIASEEPTQRGYVFGGWATELPAVTAAYRAGDAYTADANLTLYAIWTPEVYTLTLKLEDGTVWKTVEAAFGERVNMQGLIPEKASDSENHYTFAGWNENVPAYLREDIERTATFTATPLTAEEKAALTAASATTVVQTVPDEKDSPREPASSAVTGTILAVVIAAVILAIGVVLTVVIVITRRRKMAEISAAVEEAAQPEANVPAEPEQTRKDDRTEEETQSEASK